MPRWVLDALVSMLLAGMTSVVAKQGLAGISGELGVVVRTACVAVFMAGFAALAVDPAALKTLTRENWLWLGASALTTTLSWIFYYRALKAGDVATVALIDKGSVVIAMLLAWLLLKETITPRMMLGAGLIVAGLLVLVKR
jgi:transporter family protein